MIEKKRWLLITFHTTSEAMAMEQRCQEAGLAGRLIPVPRTITADCGLAWRAELSLRPQLEALTQSMDVAGYYPNMRHETAEAAFARKLPPEIMAMARAVGTLISVSTMPEYNP